MSETHSYISFHLWVLLSPGDTEWLLLMKKIITLLGQRIEGDKVLTLYTKMFNTNSWQTVVS